MCGAPSISTTILRLKSLAGTTASVPFFSRLAGQKADSESHKRAARFYRPARPEVKTSSPDLAIIEQLRRLKKERDPLDTRVRVC